MSWIIVAAIVAAVFVCVFALAEWAASRRKVDTPQGDDASDWTP